MSLREVHRKQPRERDTRNGPKDAVFRQRLARAACLRRVLRLALAALSPVALEPQPELIGRHRLAQALGDLVALGVEARMKPARRTGRGSPCELSSAASLSHASTRAIWPSASSFAAEVRHADPLRLERAEHLERLEPDLDLDLGRRRRRGGQVRRRHAHSGDVARVGVAGLGVVVERRDGAHGPARSARRAPRPPPRP